MQRFSTAEEISVTVMRAATVLARWCQLPADELADRASTAISAWASERKPAALVPFKSALCRWSRFWMALGPTEYGPLTEEGLRRCVAEVGSAGYSQPSILFYLSSINALLSGVGLMDTGLRAAYKNVRKLYTRRQERIDPNKSIPILYSDVARLVRGADAGNARDVRNTVIMLVLYEAMAQMRELLGNTTGQLQLTGGVMMSDVRFEGGGTSLLHLSPLKPGTPRRTVRLSVDATAWLQHWVSMRGDGAGPLLMIPAGIRGERSASPGPFSTPLWKGHSQFSAVAWSRGTSGQRLSAASFRLGRAVALLDAGSSLSHVAHVGQWRSPMRLAAALDTGLSLRPPARRRREPLRLRWPSPQQSSHGSGPEQLELRLLDAA